MLDGYLNFWPLGDGRNLSKKFNLLMRYLYHGITVYIAYNSTSLNCVEVKLLDKRSDGHRFIAGAGQVLLGLDKTFAWRQP